MYPNAHTKSTCALGNSVATVVAHFTFIVAVSRQTFRVFYYCGNDIEHEVKLGPPRMGIVEYVSLLKIKVTLFISTTSWVSISYYIVIIT